MQPAADELAPAGSSLVTSFTTADGNGLTSRVPSQRTEGVFAGQPTFSLGPVDLHAGEPASTDISWCGECIQLPS
jgi:hypothetical protein